MRKLAEYMGVAPKDKEATSETHYLKSISDPTYQATLKEEEKAAP